jgi:predicted CxxxxCH...CXXCH cytochrome family protein
LTPINAFTAGVEAFSDDRGHTRMRNFSTLSAALVLTVLFSACASGRNVEGVLAGGGGCVSCHGGKDNLTGAPPFDVTGATSSAAVGAHTAHLGAGVVCASCHKNVNLTNPAFPNHRDGTVNVDFGAVAFDPAGGVPTFIRSSNTCANVYCHAPSTVTTPGLGPATPSWSQGPLANGCGSCHQAPSAIHGGGLAATQCVLCHPASIDASGTLLASGTHANGTIDHFAHPSDWATGVTTTPHGLAATYQDKAHYPTGFEGCKTCHGADLTTPIASNVPNCNGCHAATWRTNCTFCHGDATNTRTPASTRPAPPRDAAGNAASAKVGAHQAHLFGDQGNNPVISDGVACTDCHGGTSRTLPTDFVHANGTTEVTLKRPGQNSATGTFDPATGTCASTYCHGNLPRNPKAGNTPSWTATSGQSTCDSCHAANGAICGGASSANCTDVRTGQHELHRCARCHGNSSTSSFATQVGCFACHAGYQRQLGGPTSVGGNNTAVVNAKVNTAIHVDGSVEVVGTTAGLVNGFSLTLTYTAPSGSNPASCTTNCHGIGSHGPVSATQTW